MSSICGTNCNECPFQEGCNGCTTTSGKPFGKECMFARCCHSKKREECAQCPDGSCGVKAQLIEEFNALKIADMKRVTELYALKGAFVNLTYTLENGQTIKLLDDNKIYLGNQLCKKGSDRCYGLAADERYLLVCEYGENGADPEIVVFKKR